METTTISIMGPAGENFPLNVQTYDAPFDTPGCIQVGGFILDDHGIQAIRWVTERGDMSMTVDGGLQCHMTASSLPFLRPYIQRTLNAGVQHTGIHLYVFTSTGHFYVGIYKIHQWKEDCLWLKPHDTPPTRNGPETGLLDALLEWNVDHTTDGIAFPVESGVTFTPDCILYHVLDERVTTWCGSKNRFNRNCLVHLLNGYPMPPAFRLLRKVSVHYRYPVLVVFVSGVTVPGGLDNHGLECILFQPATGDTCRVHFRSDADQRVAIGYGEIGDTL